MSSATLWAIEWRQADGTLAAVEPTDGEIVAAAPALAAYYDDSHNRQMMAHEQASFAAADVVAYYNGLRAMGARPFLLQVNGALVGDADFRNIAARTAEFAIMIGARALQGRGLGTRFGLMLHHFGFGRLGLERSYISVIPANVASRRMFEKVGYQIDDSPEARVFIDAESDLTLSLAGAGFRDAFAESAAAAAIRIFERPTTR